MAPRIFFVFLLFAGFGLPQTKPAVKKAPARSAATQSAPKVVETAAPEDKTRQREFPIDSIQVEGTRILTPAGVIAASGLKLGQIGDTAVFDAARDRLLATGYFENLGYRFKPSDKGNGYELTFDAREMTPLYALRAESLPATAAEISAWLKQHDPLFNGRIPGTQQALDHTARLIEAFLASKKTPVPVAGKVVLLGPQKYEAQFTPAAGLPNVALVTFEGNKAVRSTELQNAIAAVAFGQPYTENNFRVLLESQIGPVYEKKGYLRVSFLTITTTPSAQVKGVDVKVVLKEGEQYSLGNVSVIGAMADQSKHILRVAKIPPVMKVVDFDEIRSAIVRVKTALRHEGYLDVEVSMDREINDEKKTVDVVLIPQPGPQYTFGKLQVKGLGLDSVAAVEKAWVLKKGDPFPGEYPELFLRRVKEDGWFDNLGETRAEPEINQETHEVNVTLYFRYNPDATKRPKPNQAQPPQ
ncbi:MAG: surface antigen variable number repeat protein [Bryobacterales bacterium]|nr:surface antigen variable number repeat protein [Bryobacterales bacterium]